MTDMPDKGISGISYNYLNLPASMNTADGLSTGNILNLYRADGTKLRKTLTGHLPINGGITTVSVTDYLDGFQYLSTTTSGGDIFVPLAGEEGELDVAMEREAFFAENKAIINPPVNAAPDNAVRQFVPTAEGFYDFTENRYIYQYIDHLGNTRLSYAWNTTTSSLDVLDKNDYYPFGMNHLASDAGSFFGQGSYKNYKYNGKELQETGMYDYGARFYMPDIGRWGVQDLISEADPDFSPYAYVLNNPILSYDLFGFADCPNGDCPPGVTDIKPLPNSEKEVQIEGIVLTGKKGNSTLDAVQTFIDVVSWAPGVQTVGGIANAGIDIYRGNYGSAALNLFSAVPIVGYLGKGGKLINTGIKVANNVEKMKVVKAAIITSAKYSK